MDDTLSMYVISNGSSEYYPENTLSKFSVKLPLSLELPTSFNEKWGIAIQGIGLSSRFTSDYTQNNQMPLMIEIMSYDDYMACESVGKAPESEACTLEKNNLSKLIEGKSGLCFDDIDQNNHCANVDKIIEQLEKWCIKSVKSSALLTSKDESLKDKSLLYNFFFNTLKDQNSVDILTARLQLSMLLIEKKDNSNFSISNIRGVNFERMFLIRQDFFNKSIITQDTNFVNETNRILQTDDSPLFKNLTNARFLNTSSVILNNTTYKIFILNKEYLKINVDFKNFTENYLFTPNIIKIKCDNIRSQIFNNRHSKDIEVIKPRFGDKQSHYFHEFENPIYVPLLNTRLRDLTFELTDEYDDRLMLSEGLPTLLQLTFKRMNNSSKSFSIRLTPTVTNYEDSINKFSNILPETLELNDSWRVGLKEITFPSNIKSLPNDNNYIVFSKLDNEMINLTSPPYTCNIMNEFLDKISLTRFLNDRTSMLNLITFSLADNCLQAICTQNCELKISYHLAKFLNLPIPNFDDSTYIPKHIKVLLKVNTLTRIGNTINWQLFRPAYLMIYSDLVKPSLISSEYTNILRIVPVRKEEKNMEYQSFEFKNVEFREISNKFVNIINVQVRSHSGELVPFNSNFLSLHLFFTNNPT